MKYQKILFHCLVWKSPSMRREWIEIVNYIASQTKIKRSPSMRREWIEMTPPKSETETLQVSLHAEGVD